jgi:ATP-dependent Lon protease
VTEANKWLEYEVPPVVPVLLLKSTVLFPLQVASVQIAMKQNLALLEDRVTTDQIIGAGVYLDPDGHYTRRNLCSTAVACRVLSLIKMGQGTTQVVLQGLRRIVVRKITASRPYFSAHVESAHEPPVDPPSVRDLVTQVMHLLDDLVEIDERYSEELIKVVQLNFEDGSRCADFIADMIQFSYVEKRRLLETVDVSARLSLLADLLRGDIARTRVAEEVQAKTTLSIDRGQREAFLREQLNVIRRELDELDPTESQINGLAKKVEAGDLPPAVAEEAMREVQRLHSSEVRAREGSSIRAYINWVLSMPWEETTEDRFNMRRTRRFIDDRYFGLGDARDRLLEFLAVRKLTGGAQQPVLGILGPPGTGRTSLARTVADILGRRFVRIPMQGIHDEREISGQPRTGVAARPGRILDGLRKAGVRNPVLLIDELDRLEYAEPLLAIMEAVDPARNKRFVDHYLGVPFDLSQVLFIIIANIEDDIPFALWDLMHIVELSGYTERLKMAIGMERVWPQVVREHGLTDRDVRLTSAALRKIIRSYTREAGVRTMKRQLEKICRRVAVKITTRGGRRLSIGIRNVEEYLGKPPYSEQWLALVPEIGVATGLAWTEAGGALLPIEALLMPGGGKTLLTGLLGEVMQESVSAALSYVRSRAEELQIPQDALHKKDLHVHFPEGAIPKDGPSAGVAVATTIASLLSKRPVRHDVAMTGEISLRGWVLPVGGVREKVLAAYRAGIKHVILPKGNEGDLVQVPREVLRKIHVHLVGEVDEVFKLTLEKKQAPARPG